MEYLDQSFSSQNFIKILCENSLNWRGRVNIANISTEYEKVNESVKEKRKSIKDFINTHDSWTEEDLMELNLYTKQLKELKESRKCVLKKIIKDIAIKVNNPSFRFDLVKFTSNNHDVFTIDPSNFASIFALKQILKNLKDAFEVEVSNRHSIMTSLKRLLNTKMPIYIIRTDVDGFFEHIPQDKLLGKLSNNNLLSFKTKSFIKQLLNEFEQLKDKNTILPKLGIPRGICISNILSEIYMQDIDRNMKMRKEVIFYARYVDDIFLITTSIYPYKKIIDYYNEMIKLFAEYGLTLKNVGNNKCKLIEVVTIPSNNPLIVYYLGYNLHLKYEKNSLTTKYYLSDDKIQNLKQRIDNAFIHFEFLSKTNIKQARRDLLDSLKIITCNYRFHNARSIIKVGLYYNNYLLDVFDDLDDIENYLKNKTINLSSTIFQTTVEEAKFKMKLKKKIDSIDLQKNWKEKRIFSFPICRITEIQKWL